VSALRQSVRARYAHQRPAHAEDGAAERVASLLSTLSAGAALAPRRRPTPRRPARDGRRRSRAQPRPRPAQGPLPYPTPHRPARAGRRRSRARPRPRPARAARARPGPGQTPACRVGASGCGRADRSASRPASWPDMADAGMVWQRHGRHALPALYVGMGLVCAAAWRTTRARCGSRAARFRKGPVCGVAGTCLQENKRSSVCRAAAWARVSDKPSACRHAHEAHARPALGLGAPRSRAQAGRRTARQLRSACVVTAPPVSLCAHAAPACCQRRSCGRPAQVAAVVAREAPARAGGRAPCCSARRTRPHWRGRRESLAPQARPGSGRPALAPCVSSPDAGCPKRVSRAGPAPG
jgi:hypothetical protein